MSVGDWLPRRWSCALWAVGVALGVPLGLAALRVLTGQAEPAPEAPFRAELAAQPLIYGYLSFALLLVLMPLGALGGAGSGSESPAHRPGPPPTGQRPNGSRAGPSSCPRGGHTAPH
jgi:hypothetical protein